MKLSSVPVVGKRAAMVGTGAISLAARALWLAVAALAVGLLIASVIAYYRLVLTHNAPGFIDPFNTTLTPEMLGEALESLGLSARWFANYTAALILLFSTVYVATGALIFARRSHEPFALGISLWLVLFGTTFTPVTSALPAVFPLLAGPNEVLAVTAFVGFFVLFCVFPDGRFVPRWTRWVALAFVGVIGLDAVFPDSPVNLAGWEPLSTVLELGLVVAIFYSQVHRYRRVSTPSQRQQTKWVMIAMITALILFLGAGQAGNLVPMNAPVSAMLYQIIAGSIAVLGFLLVPIAIAAAILRRNLWDIDVILNRSLVYLVLSACLAGLYLAIVGSLGTLVGDGRNPVAALVAATAIAVLFAPLRERLQLTVNRMMYGERDDPYAVLARLGKRLELKLDPDAVLPTILETLVTALKLPHASIELEQGNIRLTAQVGTPRTEPLVLPLAHEGQPLGSLTVGAREGEAGFSSGDRSLLEDFARQVNVAARAVLLREEALSLASDLQRSRQRLVSAREEERLRLRRDLHDGLGPALASQTLLLDAGRKLLRQDPEAAEALLTELSAQMQEAVSDIRRVVHGLRPPALDELGLLGALREHARRLTRHGAKALVTAATPLPSVPAAVEVAAYRIASEAMTNVVRHAAAESLEVKLWVDSTGQHELLILEVADDGCGLPTQYEPGVGLRAMRERAAELGGSFSVESDPRGGTRVRVELPISEEEL